MSNIFDYDGGIMSILNKIVDCILLGVLWLIFSIPVITIGASTTALYYTVNKVIRHDRSHILREFWRGFKTNFGQSTIVWLILMAVYTLVVGNCIFFFKYKTNEVMLGFNVAVLCVFTMWALHLFPYIARFQIGTKSLMKNCVYFLVRHLLKTLILFVLLVVACLAMLTYLPFVLLSPVLYTLAATYFLEPIYFRYMSDEDYEAENERNQVYRH